MPRRSMPPAPTVSPAAPTSTISYSRRVPTCSTSSRLLYLVSEDNMGIDRQRLAQYCASGRKQVHGWLNPVDAEMFLQILLLQDSLGIQGGTAEIGVHHGKAFIPLCLGLHDNERAVCIDIFEDQTHNGALEGPGRRQKLQRSRERFSVPADRVVVLK